MVLGVDKLRPTCSTGHHQTRAALRGAYTSGAGQLRRYNCYLFELFKGLNFYGFQMLS
jgi:hypothetical protein